MVSVGNILPLPAVTACRSCGSDKLFPVLDLGVTPLAFAHGPGAEMRQALGIAVFAGMIGVTFFGLIFTPTFYVVCRWLADKLRALMGRQHHTTPPAA